MKLVTQLIYVSINNRPDDIMYYSVGLDCFYGQSWHQHDKLLETILNDII